MKAIKFAGVILALSAVSAMATDGVVTWSVGFNKANDLELGMPLYETTGMNIGFFVNVAVTGDNQGLANFLNDISITKVSGPVPGDPLVGGYINNWPTNTWGTPQVNTRGFKSPATSTKGTIEKGGLFGGPGLNVLPSLGTKDTPGYIADVGAGILDWDPLRLVSGYYGDTWEGTHQWGVGLASRKSALLVNPDADYMANFAYFPVADFVATNGQGVYRIDVNGRGAAVLSSGLDLNQPASGVLTTLTDASIVDGSAFFAVGVPEPTTLLLLAGAGAFIRRRRHA